MAPQPEHAGADSPTPEVVRLGLIGLGNWGHRLAGCVAAIHGADLTACFARDPDRRRAFAADVGCGAAASLDALLSDPDIDAVLIATPHSTHTELVRRAAAAGKHVMVEKPMTLRVADAAACIAAAEAAGVLLAVNHFRRRQAATRRIRELLMDGALGDLQQLEAYFSRPVGQQPMPGWRDDPEEAPAGGMTALGVHMVDNLQSLAGRCARVTALSKRLLGRGRIDDVTGVLLEYESGPLAYLGTSLVVPKITTTLAMGTEAAAWSDEDGTRLYVQGRDEETRTEVPVAASDPVRDSVAAFVAAVRDGTGDPVTAHEGLEVVAVLEAVQQSAARGGAPVDLDNIRRPHTLNTTEKDGP